jgi:UDP-N-acetylmuramoyl-tripeptide--D-alanyl-D-alanine ligase
MLPQNAAAAMAMALACGAPRSRIEEGLVQFKGVSGRYQVHRLQGITLIDDTYNANPASVAAGFQTLRKSFPHQTKVLILGDMLELGDESAKEHRKIGVLASESIAPNILITVGSDAKYIAEGAQSAGMERSKILSFSSVEELLRQDLNYQSLGDIVYAKGSNGIRLSRFIDTMLQNSGVKP